MKMNTRRSRLAVYAVLCEAIYDRPGDWRPKVGLHVAARAAAVVVERVPGVTPAQLRAALRTQAPARARRSVKSFAAWLEALVLLRRSAS